MWRTYKTELSNWQKRFMDDKKDIQTHHEFKYCKS